MNNILSEEAKSFKIIRPKVPNGSFKPYVSRLKRNENTTYLNLSLDQDDIFYGLKNLLGENGPSRFFMRYYFPKRFVYQTPFEIKPRKAVRVDEKVKLEAVKKNLKGFRGIPRSKLLDRRNTILDFTDLLNCLVPKERTTMVKTKVISYVMSIYPEIICYILFDNAKHNKANDIETEESEEKYTDYTLAEDKYRDYSLAEKFKEMSEEEWQKLADMIDSGASIEAFTETMFAKTSVFSLSGPAIGVSKFGFDKFIISVPFNMEKHNLIDKPRIMGKVDLLRQYKIDPEYVYPISIIKFIYQCFEAYNSGSGSNEFVNELIKHDVTFHIYAKNGIGFCVNLRELKDNLHYNSLRFIGQFINRLKLLCMINSKMVTDADLDKLDAETSDKEFDIVTSSARSDKDDIVKDELKDNIKELLDEDKIIDSIIESKFNPKEEEITEYKNGKRVAAVTDTTKHLGIANKLSAKHNITKIVSDDPDEPDIELDDSDITSILDDMETTETEDNIEEDTGDDIIVEAKDEKENEEVDESTLEESDFEDQYEEDSSDDEDIDFTDEDGESDYTKDSKKPGKAKNLSLNAEDTYKAHTGQKDQKRINLLKEKYKSLTIDGTKVTDIIGKANNIAIDNKKELGTKAPKTADPSVTNMNLANFNKSYVKNNYQADLLNAVRSLSMNKEVPLYITKVDVTDSSDQFTEKLTYSFVLEDEFKKTHNLKFDVPKLDENGFMKISGSKAYLKKQLIRKPIVKIGPDKVYITTELNAYQVYRHGVVLNKSAEVVRRLLSQFYVNNPNVKIERGDCEADNTDYLTTLEYDALSKDYFSININQDSKYGNHVIIYFSQKIIREKIEQYQINTGFKDNKIPDNILPLAIDFTNKSLYSIDINTNSSVNSTIVNIFNTVLPDEELLAFVKKIKTPKRRIMTKAEIQSFDVPLIAFLSYLFTFDKVASYFPENEIEFSETVKQKTNKLSIKFFDGYLYYNQYPLAGSMLLNGLAEIDTENYRYQDLNNPALYIDYTYSKYKTRNIVKGWVTLKESMLDFKTLQILEALNLPTDLLEIFLYCNDLLTDNHCLPESDIGNYRIRGNEIITQCLYQVLNKQYTVYKKRSGKKVSMSIPQDSVMAEVYKTDILSYYDAISPIGELRNNGLATFKGPGGTKLEQAFTKAKRSFDPSYFGVFGISTPDNRNAGVVKELTVNANIVNTLGFVGETDRKNYNFNDIVPISESVAPFATRVDDPSRIAFISGQNNHVGGMLNSSLPCVRTGVEKTIQFQCSDNFVLRCSQDCVVNEVDEINKRIYVTYKDGNKDCIDFNDKLLKNSDAFNNATYKAFVKPGMKLKPGDVFAADARFFKVDPFSNELVYTQARNGLVCIMEGSYTEDDADAITQEFADEIKMDFTERKQICIKAMDTIIDYKKVGDFVKLGDPIFVFDNSGTFEEEQDGEDSDIIDLLYKEMDINDMAEMIHQTPKAPMTGTIKEMKVFWTCPVEKMSKSAAKFVNSYINKIKKEIVAEEKFTGKTSEKRKQIVPVNKNNYTNGAPRINGLVVDAAEGNIVIEYYISHENSMGVGDKIALNTSLKSVNSYIIPQGQEPYTESGYKLDGIFSWISISARLIQSIWYQWLGTILYKKSKRIAKDFLQEIGEEVPTNKRERKIGNV